MCDLSGDWGSTVESEPREITQLLRAWQNGDRQAESKLFQTLMPDLRKIAGRCFHGERPGTLFSRPRW